MQRLTLPQQNCVLGLINACKCAIRCHHRKYCMRIYELVLKTIKPRPPLTPAQARIQGLRNRVARDKQQLQNERERQRQQREQERRRKQQQAR
jgi:hypothetical protein